MSKNATFCLCVVCFVFIYFGVQTWQFFRNTLDSVLRCNSWLYSGEHKTYRTSSDVGWPHARQANTLAIVLSLQTLCWCFHWSFLWYRQLEFLSFACFPIVVMGNRTQGLRHDGYKPLSFISCFLRQYLFPNCHSASLTTPCRNFFLDSF